MPRLIRCLLAALALLTPAAASAQDPIRFARTPDISPDGKSIAFSYQGDIYTVATIGGTATAVTSHAAHDINPVFSPDGRQIAFSSNRHGSYDVFVVSARGGKPTRLTFDSAADMACDWSRDGKSVLFASARTTDYPGGLELFSVPVEGGRVKRVVAGDGKEGAWSPKGDLLAYTRGPGSWWRKNYRGSSNDDVWLCAADGTGHRRATTFDGQDHSPMWSADGATIFYVSEAHGVANVVRQPVTPSASAKPGDKPAQVTYHTDESVRRARVSRDGTYIVYECGPDLWCVATKPGSKPRQIAIEVNADDKSNNERVVTFTRGATEYGLSGDERYAVFAVHGKLFRQQVGPNHKAVQMTFGASNDHGAVWAPDSSKVLFVSDRDGHDDLYLLEANDPDHPKLIDAHRFKVTRLTDTKEPESGVSFSPDGKRVAFLRGGKLWTMAPTGKDAKVLIDAVTVFDYEWSPDGKWIVYARRDGNFASELFLIPAAGATEKSPARNITRYATYNGGVTWSADGKRLAFLTDRRGGANLYSLELDKEPAKKPTPGIRPPIIMSWAWDGKPAIAIDFDDIHLRAKPVLRGTVEEAAVSPDGSKIAFRDAGTRDLWIVTTNGDQLTRVTTGGVSPRQIVWSKGPSRPGLIELLYFLDGNGNIRLCNAAGNVATTGGAAAAAVPGAAAGSGERTLTMPFKVKMTVKMDELYQEMFDQGWRYLAEHFYDEKHHGRDWAEVRRRYRPLVKNVTMREDLYALMYLMMGELNASHLGVQGWSPGPEEDTAELGLIWDESHKGKGLKVAEVLKRGPADKKGITLKPGEVVVAIDGVELDEKANVSKLLNGKAGEAVILLVSDKPDDPKVKPRRIELTAIGRARSQASPTAGATELMYDRWVARNAARVSALSKGKLGYIHIPSMDEAGLDRFVRSLYSDNYDKDAIVLDVRFNGGGYTHDQVLNYLGGREHAVFRNRDGGEGLVLRAWDRKWHKPLTLLINNRSFSDAEIFPNAFRTLGLGKLVGQPTGGFVIGTAPVRLIDGSTFRVPQIGVWTTKGVNMDKEGVKPDVEVENRPDELAKGTDEQLDRAVAVLQGDVIAWQKRRNGKVASRPPEGGKTTVAETKPVAPPGTSK